MKWVFLIVLFIIGIAEATYTPLFTTHDTPEKVDAEFNQIENDLQGKQFAIYGSTPILSQIRNGQIVIVSSNGWTAIMLRSNQEIYSIKVSCVTVYR